jgi:hypothetical protein
MKHDYGERDIGTPRAALDDCIAAAHRLLQFRIPLEQPACQLRWFFKQHRQDRRRSTALVQRYWTSYAHSTYGRLTDR